MNAIEIHELTKLYGKARGVKNLSFNIASGEIYSATIRCLMGLLRPTSGLCKIFGQQIITGLATQHRDIGYLPGDFHIWPGLTARKALNLMAKLGNGNKVKQNQEELAEKLDLNLDKKIGSLSKGNRQKVGIINAFQHKPKLYILDEPTVGLDPLIRMVVMDLIRNAACEGATVLLSSHDLSEVVAICQRAAILRDGCLVELAPISKIIHTGKRHLKIWFSKQIDTSLLQTNLPEDVQIIKHNENSLHLSYNGSIDRVLKWLAEFPTERITIPETSLEDAFIQYYQKPMTTARLKKEIKYDN